MYNDWESYLINELFKFKGIMQKFVKRNPKSNALYLDYGFNSKSDSLGIIKFLQMSSKLNLTDFKNNFSIDINHPFKSYEIKESEIYDSFKELDFYINQGLKSIIHNGIQLQSEFILGHPSLQVFNKEGETEIKRIPENYSYLVTAFDYVMIKNNKIVLIERKTHFGEDNSLSLDLIFLKQIHLKQITLSAYVFLLFCKFFDLGIDESNIELRITGVHIEKKIIKSWEIPYEPSIYLGNKWFQSSWYSILNGTGRLLCKCICIVCFNSIAKSNIYLEEENKYFCSSGCYKKYYSYNCRCDRLNCNKYAEYKKNGLYCNKHYKLIL